MAAPVDISVVIPTIGRSEVLARTLDALAAQDLGGVLGEVLVVDNGSAEGLDGLRSRWHGPLPLEVVVENTPGAAAARNAGIARARGSRVLFLGDDCVPASADLVAGHARADEDVAVIGQIEWDLGVEVTPVMRWLADSGHMVDYARVARADDLGPWAFYT